MTEPRYEELGVLAVLFEDAKAQGAWQERALCAQVDSGMFFPAKGESTTDAKAVCRMCEVLTECRDYALSSGEVHGVWGGLSETERRKVRRGAEIPDQTQVPGRQSAAFRRSLERDAKIAELLDEGMTYRQVANVLRIGETTVWRVRNRILRQQEAA